MEKFEYPDSLESSIRRRRRMMAIAFVLLLGLSMWTAWFSQPGAFVLPAGMAAFLVLAECYLRISERVALEDRDLLVVYDGESLILQNRRGVGLEEITLAESYLVRHASGVIALRQGQMRVRFSRHIHGFKHLQLDILQIPDPPPESG